MERREGRITVITGHHLKYLSVDTSLELGRLIREAETSWAPEYGKHFVKNFTHLLVCLLYQPDIKVQVVANQLDSFCASCRPRKQKACLFKYKLSLYQEGLRSDGAYIRHFGLTENAIYSSGWLCSSVKNTGCPPDFL